MNSRIFVRERTRFGKGAGKPRFAIVAVEGSDLKVYAQHIRKKELEKLAEVIGAEIVYLPRGDESEEGPFEEGHSKGRRRRRGEQE